MNRTFFPKLTTWVLRILLAIVAMMAVSLFMLSTLGGTTETHRRGLEQAFSDILNANIKIGRVDEFNILPQLSVRTSNVQGGFRDTKNEFRADKFEVAFGFIDLMSKHRKIENFNLANFRFAAGAAYDFHIDKASIIPGKNAYFKAQGQLDKKDFYLSIPMSQIQESRISYFFPPEAKLDGKFGSLSIATAPDKARAEQGALKNLLVSYQGKTVANGSGAPKGKGYKLNFACIAGEMPEEARRDLNIMRTLPFVVMTGCPE